MSQKKSQRKLSCACITAIILMFFCAGLGTATTEASTRSVRVWEDSMVIPTSEEGLPDPNPPFDLFNTGRFYNYPYTLRTNLVDHRIQRKWRTLNLENEYLKCIILPDLGGHLYTCTDKINGASMFYANPSIKFARIAYRGMWAALGVEFNFPVSHNWMTVSPVDFAMTGNTDGGASVWVGNIDRAYGMSWRVQLTLRPGRAYLEQRTVLYNGSDTRHRFYWWTNAGVQVWDDSRVLYPMQFTAAHGFADIDTWPVNTAGVDLSVLANHKYGPVSRFSYGSREPYMAVYHQRTSSGVVHYSSPADLPSKKIWSWGNDDDGLDWRNALSDDNSAYVEIQAGLFRDQETYGFLQPQDSIAFTEYWIPIRDLGGLSRANPNAAINLWRIQQSDADATLSLALNVTQDLPNATVELKDRERTVSSIRLSLSPRHTLRKTFGPLPSNTTYTVSISDDKGNLILRHTEDKYDFVSKDEVKPGKQTAHDYPAENQRSADDFLSMGTDEEANGRLLRALDLYQHGLQHFPDSIELNRAAGRLQIGLKQFGAGSISLSKVLERVNNDYEAAYYLGVALAAEGDLKAARSRFEQAQQFGTFRVPALLELAAVESRLGNRADALRILEQAETERQGTVRSAELQVPLLRSLRQGTRALQRSNELKRLDPTSSFLRYEAVRLGADDPELLAHLAADPERVLEIAVEYMHFGLYEDALDVLSRQYPTAPAGTSEPGTPTAGSYPLIAYYRAFCNTALGKDASVDYASASHMSLTYVFPNRRETIAVLRQAVRQNPKDAGAHFLLGSVLMSGGMSMDAIREWEEARQLKPSIPTLHRNLGQAVLRGSNSPQRAIRLFREGMQYDPGNVDLYLGLEEAMQAAGQTAAERARVLETYPDRRTAPAVLVFRLIDVLGDAGEFDAAEARLAGRFFPREENGTSAREMYIQLRLKRARTLADAGQCATAEEITSHLADSVAALPFTSNGLQQIVKTDSTQQVLQQIGAKCQAGAQAK